MKKKENAIENIENNNEVVGKEEKQSNMQEPVENKQSNEEMAIELAKKEWGISTNVFEFKATLKEEGIYEVTVRNKTTTNEETAYVVNVKTGAVTEKY